MSRRRVYGLGLGLGAGGPQREDSGLARVRADQIVPLVKEEFSRHGVEAPRRDETAALSRVIAGYLRTSSGLWPVSDELACEHLVAALVASHLQAPERGPIEARMARLVDAGFVQRACPLPSEATLAALVAVVLGRLGAGNPPASAAAQVSAADWVVALYLAGEDD